MRIDHRARSSLYLGCHELNTRAVFPALMGFAEEPICLWPLFRPFMRGAEPHLRWTERVHERST